MRQRGHGPRLTLEAGQGLGIFGEAFRQDLDRHLPAQPQVARPVDFSHPPGAERREDLVGAEDGSSGKGHSASRGF